MSRWGPVAGLVSALFLILLGGMQGFRVFEGLDTEDAFYLAVMTVSTVGYGDVHPATSAGRVVAGLLVVAGIGVFFALAKELASHVADGRLQAGMRRKRMKQSIDAMSGHIVVCGYGRMGRRACQEMAALGEPHVMIDLDETAIGEGEHANPQHLVGDATLDETLQAAGVERAAGLIACLGSDADNVFVTLAARSLGPEGMALVARAFTLEAIDKLRRAGADRVISPFEIVGPWLARAVGHPAKHDFLEVLTGAGPQAESPIDEFFVGEGSPAGMALRDSGIRERTGSIVLAVRRHGKTIMNPEADFVLETGDLVFLLRPGGHD